MTSLLFILCCQQNLIADPEGAGAHAAQVLKILGYRKPDVKPAIKEGFVGERKPAWIVTWGPFTFHHQKNGVLAYFNRKGESYQMATEHKGPRTLVADQGYLAKLVHQLGLPENAGPEFLGWKGPRPYSPDTANEMSIMPVWTGPNKKKYSLGLLTANPKDRSVTLYFPGHCRDYPDIFKPICLESSGPADQ